MNTFKQLIEKYCPDGVEYKKLSELAQLIRGRVISKEYLRDNPGPYPVYSSQTAKNGKLGSISTFDYEGEYLTWTTDGAYAGTIFYRNGRFNITNVCGLINLSSRDVLLRFLYYWLSIEAPKHVYKGMGNPKLMSNQMALVEIPVPPIPVQREIVRILDNFTSLEAELEAELEARRKQYEYYRDQLLSFKHLTGEGSNDIEWKTLGDIGEVCMCKRIMKNQTNADRGIPFYKIGTFGKTADAFISEELYEEYKQKYSFPRKGEVLISAAGTIGRAVIYDGEPAYFQDSNIVWIANDESLVLNKYLYYFYSVADWRLEGGTIKRLYNNNLKAVKIPIPPLSVQRRIVSILDRFESLVNDISSGLPAEIAARHQQYEYYRDQLLTFKRKS
jgi:type I restriction enzyme S subunit